MNAEDEFDSSQIKSEPLPEKKNNKDEPLKNLIAKGVTVFSSIVIFFSIVAIAFVPISKMFGVTFIAVHGTSMEPTYANGSNVPIIAEDELERDNLVVVKTPKAWTESGYISQSNLLFKRIVALPGDTVTLKENILTVNGANPQAMGKFGVPCSLTDAEIEIPEGKIFVMGDNRLSSFDSYAAWCTDGALDPLVSIDDIETQGDKWAFWIV